MANKRVEHWIRVLAYFEDAIEEWGERFPDKMDKVREYKQVVEEIYTHDQKDLIKESLYDTLLRKTEEARVNPKFRREHPDVFGGPVDLACDDPLYDGESVF